MSGGAGVGGLAWVRHPGQGPRWRRHGIARAVGLDAHPARDGITSGRHGLEVDRRRALGAKLGVRSVPTFVVGGQGLVGTQDVLTLRRLTLKVANRTTA